MASNTIVSSFTLDVEKGLTASPKRLFSKYFYDDNGSRIFQEIMDMPDYYLTNVELEILSLQAAEIHQNLGFNDGYNIIELGAGDGLKTKAFLSYLVHQKIDITYCPLDISQEAMNLLQADLREDLPTLEIRPLVGDYFEVLSEIDLSNRPTLFLFLGSNIGNYEESQTADLLQLFGKYMKSGDQILVGFDLKKNPKTILNAYYDKYGITKRFNLNLLHRMNTELEGNFQIDDFDFYAYYNPISGDVRSYLVSLKKQEVYIGAIKKSIYFEANELIFTELSKKYSLKEIENIATISGFQLRQHFCDEANLFADSLWVKA
jgi:dimethylhistidine N-methyltransferase